MLARGRLEGPERGERLISFRRICCMYVENVVGRRLTSWRYLEELPGRWFDLVKFFFFFCFFIDLYIFITSEGIFHSPLGLDMELPFPGTFLCLS